MSFLGFSARGWPWGFDVTPVLLAAVLVFVGLALFELSRSLPDAERGLVLFEKACPIHTSVR
jgi:hypothetical protein